MRSGIVAIGLLGACAPGGWEIVAEEAPEGAFLAVWGSGPEDVWIVGGQPGAGVVLRGDGDSFAPMPLPEGTPLLNWVHGTGPDDVWVGGLSGALLRWDGAAWTDASEAMDEAFWGVFARSADEAWAVGGASRWGGDQAVLRRFDGAAWAPLALPEEHVGLDNVFKVHHDGERPWFVGAGGAAMRGEGEGVVAVATGVSADLVTAHRGPAGPLVVVGGRGTGVRMVADGSRLTAVGDAPAGLNGVHSYGEVAVVVGENGFVGTWDLAGHGLVSEPPLTLDILHATWGWPGGRMYAVGGNLATAGDTFHGVILSARAPESP